MEFASGKQISCVVKMCDMGSTTLQETTVLYSVRQLPVNGLDARVVQQFVEEEKVENDATIFERPYALELLSRKGAFNRRWTSGKKIDARWLVDAGSDSILYMSDKSDNINYYNGDNQRVCLSGSFQKPIELNIEHNELFVHFKKKDRTGRFRNRYFDANRRTYDFLKLVQNALVEHERYEDNNIADTASQNLKDFFDKYAVSGNRIQERGGFGSDSQTRMVLRRRMAQREFSSRRDSPVMVRLLEQIVRANEKHNELN